MSFEVEQLSVEDDRLVITGHWSGVRGMRFVRPTLVMGDRHVHATLEHKPWAPTLGEPWTAAFPWSRGDAIDASRLELAVAPSVTVPLGPQDEEELDMDAPLTQPAAAAVAPAAVAVPVPTAAPASAAEQAPAAEPEPALHGPEPHVELRAQLDEALALLADREARCEELEQVLQSERQAAYAAVSEHDELHHARSAAERERDSALEQRDEALRDRAAAVRTRARMEGRHDEAVIAREVAESELESVMGERDEMRAQRDEVLVAYRALQRNAQRQRADEDRLLTEPLPDVADEVDQTQPLPQAGQPPAAEVHPDRPIGVRKVPAARRLVADLERPEPKCFVFSQFDIWAIRVLGSVAAAAFILLLVAIVRVFV